MLGIPAAAVTVMTLILSRGNFIAAIGAGIGTAVSVYVTNYRLIAKVNFLEEKTKYLEEENKYLEERIKYLESITNGLGTHSNSSELERIKNTSASSREDPMSFQEDIESFKRKLSE